ncbi:Peptidoglycan D,D-transpeptidase MrdA [Streptomyces violaceorubidus]
MASNPDLRPNAWVGGISAKDYKKLTGKDSNYPLLNRNIQGQAAPGSIFKVVSSAAAVEAGYDFDGNYKLLQRLRRRRPGLQELRVGQRKA